MKSPLAFLGAVQVATGVLFVLLFGAVALPQIGVMISAPSPGQATLLALLPISLTAAGVAFVFAGISKRRSA